jgi:2-polyprenyl-3-methyl-5-hydroxy-6-metoxy-1,4-benzoquinol methylase
VTDRAGQSYWEAHWRQQRSPRGRGEFRWLRAHWKRAFDRLFHAALDRRQPRGQRLLEIGCANSSWLPYFASEFGFEISGIDYSDEGCRQSRQALSVAAQAGEIVCEDFFTPPARMLGAFDVVVSFGVIEHFADTAECIAAMGRFLKPGGLMIASIPNMTGLIGFLQKALNRPVYDIHVPLAPGDLAGAIQKAGLQLISCDYFMSTNFAVCNLNGIVPGSPSYAVKRGLLSALTAVTAGAWLVEEMAGPLPTNRWTSPYVACVAAKPSPPQ